MKLLSIKRDDGGLSIMRLLGKSADKAIANWEKSTGRRAVSVREMRDGEQLPDRDFREAWDDDGSDITVDMEKARAIKMAGIRERRNRRLEELDVAVSRAQDDDDKEALANLRAKRKILRDLPARIRLDRINSPAELKDFDPYELGE